MENQVEQNKGNEGDGTNSTPGMFGYVADPSVTPDSEPPRRRAVRWIVPVILLLLLLGLLSVGAFFFLTGRGTGDDRQTAGTFDIAQLPVDELTDQALLAIEDAQSLNINGQLLVNNSLVLSPMARPANPVAGELYYNQSTNKLEYYNGSKFISVADNEGVENLGGVSGSVALGGGLGVNGASLLNTGVLSLQGQTGAVTLNPGRGITIDGTTISSSGILNLLGGDNISIASDSNGTYTINSTGGSSGGNVSTSGGTVGRIAKFTGVQSIGDSLLSESGSTITVNGNLSVTGSTTLGTPLSVSSGGIGVGTLANNGVLIGQGTGAVTTATSGSAGLCLVSTAGAPVFQACPGSAGVSSLNGLGGALTIANSSGSGSTITINDASTSSKGIAQFNSTNFTAAGGTVNTIQDIDTSASPSFAGLTTTGSATIGGDLNVSGGSIQTGGTTRIDNGGNLVNINNVTANGNLTVQGGSATVGVAGSQTGSLTLAHNGSSFTGTLRTAALGQNTTYTLPDPGQASASICLSTGNCSGVGQAVDSLNGLMGDLTLQGTTGQIAVNDDGVDTLTLSLDPAVTLQGNTFNGPDQLVKLDASSQLPAVSGALLTNLNASALSSGTVDNARLTNGGALTVNAGTGLTGGGNVALGGSTTLNVAYGSTAGTAVQGNTALTCPSGSGNLTGGGNSITLGAGGACNALDTVDDPTFGTSVTTPLLTSSGTLDITSIGAMTVGTNGQALTLQGNGSTSLSATSGGFTSTLGFLTPTANRSITLPDESGIVCLQNSGSCGFLVGSGTAYIQGGNSFGAAGDLGTNDNFALNLRTNGTTRLTVAADGSNITLASNTNLLLQGASAYISNPQGQTNSEAFGLNASVTANNALAVGNNATAGNDDVAIGSGAIAGTWSVAIGSQSEAAQYGVAVGEGAYADFQSVAIGRQANTNGNGFGGSQSIAIGYGATTSGNEQIAIGYGATTTANGQLVIGSNDAPITQAFIGGGIASANPQSVTLNATGGSGTNIQGASLNLAGGAGTGNAAGGNINLQVATPGTSGSSANVPTTVLSLSGTNGSARFQNAANSTTAFQVQNAGGASLFTIDSSNALTRIDPTGISGDATLASGTGALQIGSNTGLNLALDNNEIIARNNGGTSTLFLQNEGGGLNVGANSSVFQPASNGDTLTVLNATGNRVVNIDTAEGELELGAGGTLNGTLLFRNATNGFVSILQAPTLTAHRSVTLPDESGVVCLRNSTNCGFAAASGSGNYIQNTTTVQTGANIAIESGADTDTTLLLRNRATQSADILRIEDNGGNRLLSVDTFGGLTHTNSATFESYVGVGLPGAATSGVALRVFTPSTSDIGVQINGGAGQTGDLLQANGNSSSTLTYTADGALRNSADSTTALQIQNAAGTATVLNVDTTTTRVGIGTATADAKLDIVHTDVNESALKLHALAGQVADLFVAYDGEGQRTTYLNEKGELRVIAADPNTVAVRIKQRDGTQTGNLTEWADVSNNILSYFNAAGNLSIGTGAALPNNVKLQVVQGGTLPTINNRTRALISNTASAGSNVNMSLISGNTGNSSIFFGDTDAEDVGQIEYNHTSNFMRFATNGTEALRITSAGDIIVQGGDATLGSSTQQGSLVLHDGNGQTATILMGSGLAANTTITLPDNVGTSDTFCLVTLANCSGGGGGGDILQGGNSFAQDMTIGTNDAFALNLETNGTTRLSIADDGSKMALLGTGTNDNGLELVFGSNVAWAPSIYSLSDADVPWFGEDILAFRVAGLQFGADDSTPAYTLDAFNGRHSFISQSDFGWFQFRDEVDNILFNINGDTGAVTIQNNANTTQAFQVLNAAGANVLTADTAGNSVNLSSTGQLTFDNGTGDQLIKNSSGTLQIANYDTGGAVQVQADSFAFQNTTDFTSNLEINGTGQATFQNSADSASAFRVLKGNGSLLFQIDTVANRVYIGDPGGDANGALLVLSNRTAAGDPTGVDGGMYYNSTSGKLRCYENGQWKDCLGTTETITFLGSNGEGTVSQWAGGMPAALTELFGKTTMRVPYDLSSASQARIVVNVATLGGSVHNGKFRVQYSTDQSTWNYLDGGTGPSVDVGDSLGLKVSGWINITAAAKSDIYLRIVGIDGDNVVTPRFGVIQVQIR